VKTAVSLLTLALAGAPAAAHAEAPKYHVLPSGRVRPSLYRWRTALWLATAEEASGSGFDIFQTMNSGEGT
jgi:hypothetical protein